MKEILLTQGNVAIVDDEDFDRLMQHSWHIGIYGYKIYAIRMTHLPNRHKVFMHKEVLAVPEGFVADHIDGNSLNNQKRNLRFVTVKQNARNRKKRLTSSTSIYKGVSYRKESKKYRARIVVDYAIIHLGQFDSEILAARVYNAAALKYFGEFAQLNTIP